MNCPQLGIRDLPSAQNLQQQRFDVVVYFVELVDQKHARLNFMAQCAQERPFRKEVQRVQPAPDLVPAPAEGRGLGVQEQLLQRLVELTNELFFGNPS